jgi:hypothetical protein
VKSAEIHPNLAPFIKPKSNERNHSYNPAFPKATRKESQWCNPLGIVVILIAGIRSGKGRARRGWR